MEPQAEPPSAVGTPPAIDPVGPSLQSTPKGGFILGFALTGLVTIVLSSMTTRVSDIPSTAEFGLLELLPWGYWVGLSMMGLAVFLAVRSGRSGLFAVTGTLLFAMFAGTPVLFEPNPPVWDAYTHFAAAQTVGFNGRLPGAEVVGYSTNWPGFFLLTWIFSDATNATPLGMLSLFPFLTSALTFLALFVFLRSLFDPTTAAIGSVLGSLLNAWAQFHLSPQSIGLVLALLVLGTIWRRRTPFRIASAVLFVGLVVTHPTSTILILGIVIVDVTLTYALRLRRSPKSPLGGRERAFAYSPALPFVAVWLAWLFFQATGSSQVAETAILTQMSSILQVPEQTLNLATARSVENIFIWGPLIRLAGLVSFGIIGIVGLIVLSRTRASRRLSQFLWAALISLVVFTLTDILLQSGLFFDRAFMLFALLTPTIGVAGIAALRLRMPMRAIILAVFLVISMAMASTLYYQEAFYFVSAESVAVSEFLEA
ncbi:MAG: hypothetical protein V3U33_05770, partial [candidate division NC10 bacterium]